MIAYVFLMQRPQDKEPWPVVYRDPELADKAFGRASPVRAVDLSESNTGMSDEAKAAFRAAVREINDIGKNALRTELDARIAEVTRISCRAYRLEEQLREASEIIDYFISCRRKEGWRIVSPAGSDEPSLMAALEKARQYRAAHGEGDSR